MKNFKGFTLIEILVVIGIIAILAGIVLVAINPARQFAQAHNTQRTSNVEAILNAIGQNMADNKGVFMCNGTPYSIAATPTDIKNGASGADLAPCLTPTYIEAMPEDPIGSSTCIASYATVTSYDTCYTVFQDPTTARITVSAPAAELGEQISITR